ncbi:MAG TPA: site-2 protease family protein [Candidatus Aquicultor sp.]|jgi:Zn-dependent protease/CBS domain-containing protein
MESGIRIGKILGIDISLDYSWFVIFALITFGLAFALFPQLAPDLNSTTYVILGLITSVLFFASVLLHEIMHSLVAKRYGMKIEGIRLMIFGGVSQLSDEPHSAGVEFKMALAGPLTSIILGGIFMGLFFIGRQMHLAVMFLVPTFWLGYINLLLGVFNLLPGFPLDGGRVLRSAIWHFTGNLKRATSIASNFGKGLSYLMILVGVFGIATLNYNLTWFLLIGWYLLRAAETGYQQVIIEEAMEGLKVAHAMTQNPETVAPDINIESMVKEHFMQHNWVAYPVVENNSVKGIITISNIKGLPPRSWGRKLVRDVMIPISTDIVATPDMELSEALSKLDAKDDRRLLVMQGGHLLGILSRLDVRRTIVNKLRKQAEEDESRNDQKTAA